MAKTHSTYDALLYLGYNALVGNDSVHSSINITTPLAPGVEFNYHYFEGPITLTLGFGYRNFKFNDDKDNNIPVHNKASEHDLNLKYQIQAQLIDRLRASFEAFYLNQYFFQSIPGQAYVETRAGYGVNLTFGLEYDLIDNNDLTATLQGGYGISGSIADIKTGSAAKLGLKLNQKYSSDFNLIYILSYVETHTTTNANIDVIESSQGRADLNLRLGLEKKF